MSKKIILVDTSFFINYKFLEGEIYTVNSVVEELKSLNSRFRFEAVSPIVYKPSKRNIDKIKEIAKSKGEKISHADAELLAAAIELAKYHDLILLSDDFAVQNIAKHLGIEFQGVSKKIKKEIDWISICNSCGHEFLGLEVCPNCGSEDVSRRPRRIKSS